jgi:hypothetical protein
MVEMIVSIAIIGIVSVMFITIYAVAMQQSQKSIDVNKVSKSSQSLTEISSDMTETGKMDFNLTINGQDFNPSKKQYTVYKSNTGYYETFNLTK